jgi:hypothetical protein
MEQVFAPRLLIRKGKFMIDGLKGLIMEAFEISASYAQEEFFFNHPELKISNMAYRH